jgi:hypothetical protein
MEILYDQNDHSLTLIRSNGKGLQNEITGLYVNDATVTATLKRKNGVVVSGQSFPVTLDYVAGTDGIYRVVLLSTLEVEVGDLLIAEVTIVAPGDSHAFFSKDIYVARRS